MTTFPALQPGSRAFIPGTYPGATFRTLSGRDSRVRHSNAVVAMQAKAEFPLLSESQLESIRSHYVGQKGGHKSFAVPDEFWSGADTPAGFTPSGYQWRYAGKPSIEEITIDTSGTAATLFNVSIELEAVPLAAVVLSGATFNITTTWLPGYKSVSATGATWDVAVSWVPGGSSTWPPGSDPYFANVAVLVNGSSTTNLSTAYTAPLTVAGSPTIVSSAPWDGSSISFNGTSSVLSTSAVSLGTSDFTLEAYIKPTVISEAGVISQGNSDSTGNFAFGVRPNGQILFYANNQLRIVTTQAITANAWSHIALTRSGSTYTCYINGNVAGTLSGSFTHTGSPLKISHGYGGIGYFNGLIASARVTIGVARTITVPTGPYPTA